MKGSKPLQPQQDNQDGLLLTQNLIIQFLQTMQGVPYLCLQSVQSLLLGLPHIYYGDGVDLCDLVDVWHTPLDDLSCRTGTGSRWSQHLYLSELA